MGISGLLPLLKPIQVSKHLSEYAGQTIAVDAYVWLHRGTYSCATDLVTGKKTNKYVDYCMHRVRLLKHHNITPYIVFDGGPLPAKKGTESDRKKKREENVARANALAAQGKHTQARDFYVKCIDITPQMAYQFIKALRAENVAYVVAPYEADAQMAYMERMGVVDGILTEDSDLLVFGCKNVLLKLNAVESTVISISRADFASMATSAGGGISLLGWSDVQFRAMAILSGCDYLPSIPSVGLKTAWSLLRKHKTVENVIRVLRIEGKKSVPKGYLQAFKLAEKVFLHQRVYDPAKRMLVHLCPLPDGEDWDEEKEAHVGRYIEPSLAEKVAVGDACPVTLLPMEDINPTFVPRALRTIPLHSQSADAKRKGKEKMTVPDKARSSTILTFFTPKARAQHRRDSAPQSVAVPGATPMVVITSAVAGQSSGKRTLTEVMEHDTASKRQRRKERELPVTPTRRMPQGTRSKFFAGAFSSRPKRRHAANDTSDTEAVAGPSSGLGQLRHNKENIPSLPSEDELDESEISMDEAADPVTQEDGYMSPSPSFSRWDSPELSSPLRPRRTTPSPSIATGEVADFDKDDDYFDAEILSSPGGPARRRDLARNVPPIPFPSAGNVLVHGTPTPSKKCGGRAASPEQLGPDLRDMFEDWSDGTSDIDESNEDSMESVASSSEPVTPESSGQRVVCVEESSYEEMTLDLEGMQSELPAATRDGRMANGWWDRWACPKAIPANKQSKIGTLRRSETTVTPEGRHHPVRSSASKTKHQDLRATNRKSLPFLSQTKAMEKTRSAAPNVHGAAARPGSSQSERAEDIILDAKNRLAEFRYVAS